jgi:predicted Zn finger-like uncharacterized protein
MLKVECEACKAPYQVDERRVLPGGLKMRCPKCGHTFVVNNPNAPPAPPAVPKQTLPGAFGSVAPAASKPLVGFGGADDPFANLPQTKPAKATLQGLSPSPLGGIDELTDLPSLPEEAGLPALAPKKPAVPRPLNQTLPGSPVPRPPSLQDFQIDLSSGSGAGGELDLPQAKRQDKRSLTFDVDLPSPAAELPSAKRGAARGAIADLPVVAAGLPSPANALPVVSQGAAKKRIGGAFGEIDLPSVGGNLPATLPRDHHLPAPVAAGLPSPTAPGPYLPSAAAPGHNLPASTAPGHNLPSVLDPSQNLPSVIGDERHLPAVAESLPSPVSDERYLPSKLGGAADDFAELDLPPPPPRTSGRPPLSAPPRSGEELDLPPARSGPPSHKADSRATGGVGFGEVDLGEGAAGDLPFAIAPDEAAQQQRTAAGAEAALPTAPAKRRAAADVGEIVTSKAPKIALGVIALLVIGGVALQLTPYGAFGYLMIGDLLHAPEWRRMADDASANTRKAMASEVYAQTRAAVDELGVLHNHTPRAKPIAAYAALAEYEAQLRFGRDTERAARASQWLADVQRSSSAAGEVRYFAIASAAQAAVNDDLVTARRGLEAASKRDGGDPVQQDIALTRGEVELAAKDATAAGAAFRKAVDIASTPRAHFGLARAYALGGEVDKAQGEIRTTLTGAPLDPGALVLRATLAWDKDKNDSAAAQDLDTVIDGKAKGTASPGDLSKAYSLRGWTEAARGRSADARTSFDAALKLDPRNVSALLGQGEVLFTEGRYTEALSRFDTGVQVDPTNAAAIASDAKAKIALERLADAKTQLTTARQANPNDMRIVYWLGKAEEALGNKKAAEDAYTAAITLADPTSPEAINPYVALSELLAGEGRATEAQAKLDQARQKLPDSAAMQRALGEVAAVQGLYDDAINHYQAAVSKDPQDLSSRFLLGVTYRRMQKIDEAGEEFDQVLAADKEYPGLAMERGLLYEQSGEIEKALAQFSVALQKAPDDPDLQLRVGAAYVGMNRPNDAEPLLKKVMEKRPNSAEANYFLGRAFFQKGGVFEADALRYLKRAVALDPNRPEYHLYLAWIANEGISPQLGVAEQEIKKALELDRMLADGYWQRGALECKKSEVEDGIKDLRRALTLKPTRFEAHAALAQCYEAKNDQATAMAEWAKAIAGDDSQISWRYSYGKQLYDHAKFALALGHLSFAVTAGENLEQGGSPAPVWLGPAEFLLAEVLRRGGKKQDAIEHYNRFLHKAPTNSPDRRDALKALAALGAPYDER